MENTVNVDLEQVARDVDLPIAKVQPTVELLDDGNTVPFITRYRKDQTGGLDEEQIRCVQESVAKLRALADRKQRILKTLQSQAKLTDELAERVNRCPSLRRLEDLYQPFKAKKQTLAGVARSRGLEPLAREILEGGPAIADLKARAEEYVDQEKELPTAADVLQGAGHLIAEQFSENLPLRDELRKVLKNTGVLIASRIEEAAETPHDEPVPEQPSSRETEVADSQDSGTPQPEKTGDTQSPEPEGSSSAQPSDADSLPTQEGDSDAAAASSGQSEEPASPPSDDSASGEPSVGQAEAVEPPPSPEEVTSPEEPVQADEQPASEQPAAPAEEISSDEEQAPSAPEPEAPADGVPDSRQSPPAVSVEPKPRPTVKQIAAQQRKEAKKRKRQKKIESFKDYFDFREPLTKIPPHRLLAMNRGERSKILRVRVDADTDAMGEKAEQMLVPAQHPHGQYLRGCVRDALARLIIPSLERDVRRELTDKAEAHAVRVFARNLRKLLLQPPVRDRRVLAVDPGFRSGCKLAALDEFGNVLGHTVIHVIGKADSVRRGRQQVVEMITLYHIPVIAIGNGTACRETERLIADILAKELANHDVQYLTVNEAGASVYSTSPLGREELPKFDPVLRSAVSIGRRLQDPLSELVKINPANIGVGLYQHDVKAKHLETSLDAVVESCVNFVGVDVNTASPSLMRYVSGLNQLTARRLYEYRQQHGPFRNRDQFKDVPGFGDATFVQAAGFLRIINGDNPLDATWIHPESYEAAGRVIEELGSSVSELAASVATSEESAETEQPKPEQKREPAAEQEQPPQEPAAASAGDQGKSPAAADEPPEQQTAASEVPDESAEAEVATEEPGESTEAASVTAEVSDEPAEAAVATDEPGESTEAEAITAEVSDEPTEVPEATDEPDDSTDAAAIAVEVPDEPPEPTEATEEPGESTEAAAEVPDEPAEATTVATDEPDKPTEVVATEKSLSLAERTAKADVAAMAAKLEIGELLLKDILSSITRPGRDPREDLPAPAFRREVMKLEDIRPEMELSGTVLNVVDFGAFVDIGLPDSGLIHISRLADRYVRDPHEVVSVGDILTVWVVGVDKQRRRVSLTAIKPGTETPREERKDKPPRRDRRPRKPEGKPRGRHSEGKRQARHAKGGKPKYEHRRPQKKKPPAPPITDAMAEGKEPMRTFSDLLQFYERKSTDDEEEEKKS